MQLTIHGYGHILGRTEASAQDVLDIIAKDAYVCLGVEKNMRYLLFYSPNDNDVKIALVSIKERRLVSIWNKHFAVPQTLTPISPELEQDARRLYEALGKETRTSPRKRGECEIELEIRAGHKFERREFRTNLGTCHHSLIDHPYFVRVFKDTLTTIVQTIESFDPIHASAYLYIFIVHSPLSRKRKYLRFDHATIRRRIEAG